MTIVLIIRRDAGMADNKKITSANEKGNKATTTASKASAEVKAEAKKTEAAIEKEIKEAAEKVEEKVAEVKKTVKSTATKASTAVKKTAAKKTATAKSAVEKKTTATRTSNKGKIANIYVQYNNCETKQEELIKRIIEKWVEESGKKESSIKTFDVYIKPEDNAAYYVINGQGSSITLF